MAIEWVPGLTRLKSYNSLEEAQADSTLENRMLCFVAGLLHRKINAEVHPVGTFISAFAAFPIVGDSGVLYIDPFDKALYLWMGGAYVDLFATTDAHFWQTVSATGEYTMTRAISAGSSLDIPFGQFDYKMTEDNGLIQGFTDGSTGISTFEDGTWIAPSDGDFLISGRLRLKRLELTNGGANFSTYRGTIAEIALAKYGNPLAPDPGPVTWFRVGTPLGKETVHIRPASATSLLGLPLGGSYTGANVQEDIDFVFSRLLIGVKTNEEYGFFFSATSDGLIAASGGVTLRAVFDGSFTATIYQQQGIPDWLQNPNPEFNSIRVLNDAVVEGDMEVDGVVSVGDATSGEHAVNLNLANEMFVSKVNTPARAFPWSASEARGLDILSYNRDGNEFFVSFLLNIKLDSTNQSSGFVVRYTASTIIAQMEFLSGSVPPAVFDVGGFQILDEQISGSSRKIHLFLSSGIAEYNNMTVTVLNGFTAGEVSAESWINTAYYAGGGSGDSTSYSTGVTHTKRLKAFDLPTSLPSGATKAGNLAITTDGQVYIE
jgi:hypothetical protein